MRMAVYISLPLTLILRRELSPHSSATSLQCLVMPMQGTRVINDGVLLRSRPGAVVSSSVATLQRTLGHGTRVSADAEGMRYHVSLLWT